MLGENLEVSDLHMGGAERAPGGGGKWRCE